MKDNEIRFITPDSDIFECHKPEPSSKSIPDWYKKLPAIHDKVPGYMETGENPTIKKCMPVLDYLTTGYVIKNTYQVCVQPTLDAKGFVDYTVLCADQEYVARHPWHQVKVQTSGENRHFIKFQHGWVIKTPPGYSCMIYQPHYIYRKEFTILPAIVDTDKHNDVVVLVASVESREAFTIKSGDPLAVVFPFKRESWQSKHEWDPKIFTKSSFKFFFSGFWHGTYQKFFHNKKSFK